MIVNDDEDDDFNDLDLNIPTQKDNFGAFGIVFVSIKSNEYCPIKY